MKNGMSTLGKIFFLIVILTTLGHAIWKISSQSSDPLRRIEDSHFTIRTETSTGVSSEEWIEAETVKVTFDTLVVEGTDYIRQEKFVFMTHTDTPVTLTIGEQTPVQAIEVWVYFTDGQLLAIKWKTSNDEWQMAAAVIGQTITITP